MSDGLPGAKQGNLQQRRSVPVYEQVVVDFPPKCPKTGRKANNQAKNPDMGHTNKGFPIDRSCTGSIRYAPT